MSLLAYKQSNNLNYNFIMSYDFFFAKTITLK